MSRRVLNASCLCSEKWLLDYRSLCLSWVQWLFGKGEKNKNNEKQTSIRWATKRQVCEEPLRQSLFVCGQGCLSLCAFWDVEEKESCTMVQQSESFPNCYGDPQILLLLIALDNLMLLFNIYFSLVLSGLLETKMCDISHHR